MTTEKDLIANSWQELTELLFHDTWLESRQRFLSPFSYRGIRNKDFNLKTSYNRIGTTHGDNELHILRNFKKYAYPYAKGFVNDWEWLSLAQHHGVATRLLDWTFSPFIAVHFAIDTEFDMDKDAAIWCVNRAESKKFLPAQLQNYLADEKGPLVFTCDQLYTQIKNLPELDHIDAEEFIIFLEPPVLDERISNQYAHFSMLNRQDEYQDSWIIQHPQLYFRIIIPAALKWEIRDRLDQSNINERILFPGLSGLSKWLNRHYTPRPKFLK